MMLRLRIVIEQLIESFHFAECMKPTKPHETVANPITF